MASGFLQPCTLAIVVVTIACLTVARAAPSIRKRSDGGPLSLVSAEARPTKQPATRGQDLLECGYLMLPSEFLLAPHPPGHLTLSGSWESSDGATYATWDQQLMLWRSRPVVYTLGAKVLFKAMLYRSSNSPALEVHLPPPKHTEVADAAPEDFQVVAFRDCNGVLMYLMRVHVELSHVVEVFNSLGELVAYSGVPLDHIADQIHFTDELGLPLAIAQSPVITGDVQDVQAAMDGYPPRRRPEPEPGFVQPWEIWFMPEQQSNSSLALSQNRWVLAAVVQDRALRDAAKTRPITFGAVANSLVGLAAPLCLVIVVVSLVYTIHRVLFRLVYPIKEEPPAFNPFMQKEESGVYGALLSQSLMMGSRASKA